MDYVWSKEKEASCQWIINRIQPKTKGVDVGGTQYLCERLREKGCDITYFDWFKPENFEPSVQDDMMNILNHFEEQSFDFITTRHTLEHSLCALFQLWCYNKLLKDGGKLYVIVPMPNSNWVWFNTHFSVFPHENWVMFFHRAGFKIITSDAGTWKPYDPKFIEFRYELQVETRDLRL